MERSHGHSCLVRPFCVGRWAPVCARRPSRPVGSPWRNCCGDPRAGTGCVDAYHGLAERTEARRSGECARSLGASTSPAIRLLAPLHSPPIARVRLGHACAARADRRRLAFTRTTVTRVARSARGRPAAASAWASRSHGPAPTPDRTRSKRRRGAPRCRTSVRADRAARRTTNPRQARPVRLHAWHPTKCR